MQNKANILKRMLSFILCIMLITAIALSGSGCTAYNTYKSVTETGSSAEAEIETMGEGATEFNFTVTNAEGESTAYIIKTDKKTVGDALLELGLIEGDAGPYGLYVKTVDGVTLDFEKDGKYWAFYVNGEYAVSGVDATEIENGASYTFKAE